MGLEKMKENYLIIMNFLPLFLKGTLTTIYVFLSAGSLSLFLGTIFGVFSSKYFQISFLSKTIELINFITRAIPFFVQLLICYFVIPELLHIDISSFTASVISLGICSSGYVAQFIRGSINAVSIIQIEAAFTLGYSPTKTLLNIILPQAFRIALPSLNNELDALLKSTAIISSIGILELTRIAMNLVSREMKPIPIYLFIAFLYLCLSSVLNIFTKTLEKRLSYVKN